MMYVVAGTNSSDESIANRRCCLCLVGATPPFDPHQIIDYIVAVRFVVVAVRVQ